MMKKKVLDIVEVEVKGYEYIEDVLRRYPSYVVYDHRKHDADGMTVRHDRISWGVPDYSYKIVLEVN